MRTNTIQHALSTAAVLLVAACGGGAGPTDAAGREPLDAGGADASQVVADAGALPMDAGADSGAVEPRLVTLSRDGKAASLELADPFPVKATADFGATIRSVRCRGSRCAAVHPTPVDSIRVFDARDLQVTGLIALEPGADPRDVAWVDDRTVVVSQYERATLLEMDVVTQTKTPIDLAVLADADGLPEAGRLASCGPRVFVQLRRDEHASGTPSGVPAVLAVIDLQRAGSDRLVDADLATAGVQGIALAERPDFDMPVDCASGLLYVAEPRPLMQGGGGYEQVDLTTLTASDFPVDTGAEVGGFEVLTPENYWLITHTEFGPGPSSHLNCFGGTNPTTTNTFAPEHVNDLALDRISDLLFFPDPCSTQTFPSCDGGLHVFHARSGELAAPTAVKVGFPPIEVAVAR